MKLFKGLAKQNNVMLWIGLSVCVIWVYIAIFVPLFGLQDPVIQDISNRFAAPGGGHLFGTDDLGRDVFSRVMFASRMSITAGVITVIFAMCVGSLYGAIAGYFGKAFDNIMMRFSEMIQSFPPIILAMVIAAAMGPSVSNSVVAMAVIWWPNYARLTRSIVISQKENDYITAGKILGASRMRILFKEILPGCVGPLLVMSTLDLGNAILMFAGLSFLGLGVQPPTPEWGAMVSDGVANMNYWWMSAFPGLAIFTVAIGANFLGDGLRDYLDPHLRNQM